MPPKPLYKPDMAGGRQETQSVIHASCVAFSGAGLLIAGPSGSGKSSLALQLMAHGATLVSDDRTRLDAPGGVLRASVPPQIAGLIEARGLGLLSADTRNNVPVRAMVGLGTTETERLPPHRTTSLLGQSIVLLHKVESPYFAAALLQYLKGDRRSA